MTTADANFRTSGAPGRADFLCFSRFDFGKSRNNKKMQTSLFYQIFLTIFKISNVIGGVIKHRAPPNIHAPTFIRRSAQKKNTEPEQPQIANCPENGHESKKKLISAPGAPRRRRGAPSTIRPPRPERAPRSGRFFFLEVFCRKTQKMQIPEKSFITTEPPKKQKTKEKEQRNKEKVRAGLRKIGLRPAQATTEHS